MSNYYRDCRRFEPLPHLPVKHLPAEFTTIKPLSFLERPSSPNYTRRNALDLQEQLQSLKDEMRKKDELLCNMSRYGPQHHRGYPEPAWYTPDRHGIEATYAADIAGMQTKINHLQQKLSESQDEINKKDTKVKELEQTVDNQREGEARLTAMVQTLRERIASMETAASSFEGATGRTELTISMLETENRNCNERIRDLEARLKKILDEREEAQQKVDASDKKMNELVGQIRTLLRGDDHVSDYVPISSDNLLSKLSGIIQENAMLKSRTAMLSQNLTDTELESKASRETIMRLVAEVGKDQKAAADMDLLRVERNNAVASKQDLEKEVELLKERLQSNQRALDAMRDELSQKDSRLTNLNRERHEVHHTISSSKTQYGLLMEQVAMMLSDAYHKVDPHETAIKNQIMHLQASYREKDNRIRDLEEEMKHLRDDYDKQYNKRYESIISQAKYSEIDISQIQSRLHLAEEELAKLEVTKESLKRDKNTYIKFLDQLSRIMKMEGSTCHIDFDMVTDAILSRAEQLMRQECDTSIKSTTYNFQRKVKDLKEQLQSKEVHIEMLRKKITSLEEKLLDKTDSERKRDGEYVRSKKLEKLVEKYKMQLCEARNEITCLKGQLLNTKDLRAENIDRRKDVTELQAQVDELQHVRDKQARKIGSLKRDLEDDKMAREEKCGTSDKAVHCLSSELRSTKNALNVIQDREKQLIDFRNVVARMLGLDISTLAIPDYEIVTRLEKLVQAQHSLAFTAGLGESLTDMEPNFVSGYRQAMADERANLRQRSRLRERSRARSLSPVRRDPRVY